MTSTSVQRFFAAWVLLLLALCSRGAQANKLDRVSDAARSSNSSSSSNTSSSSSSSSGGGGYSSCHSCGGHDASDGDGALILLAAITSPWWVPYVALESEPSLSVGFPRYPYASPSSGSMVIDYGPTEHELFEGAPAQPAPQPKRNWAFQLGAESGYVFDRVFRQGVNLRFQTAYRFEFDANWALFSEHEPGWSTQLALGREHLVIRFAQSQNVQFHTSIGAQHLIDNRGDLSGVDIAYGFEAFPGKPITFALEGALGNIGSVFAPRVRATLGVIQGRFEFLLGYEHQWIGSETLGGPFAGVRWWL